MPVEVLVNILVPALIALMVLEYAVARRRGRSVYGHRQTLGNLATAVGNRAFALGMGLVPLLGYAWLEDRVGLFEWSTDSGWQWALGFLAVDLALYWRHRLGHQVTLLWNAHAVHHQSGEFNLSAGLRFGWLEEPITFAFPLAFLGMPASMVLVLYGGCKLYSYLVHTELVPRLGWADRVLMTPSSHRVHHGANPRYLDRNYGNTLAIWDVLFGTFTAEEEPVVFGTVEGLTSYDALENNLAPWRKMMERMRHARDLWAAVQVPFRSPGWGQGPLRLDTDVERFPKRSVFPTFVSRMAGTAWLAVGLGGVVALGAWAGPLGVGGRLGVATAAIGALVAAGAYLDRETGLPGALPPWAVRALWRVGGGPIRRAVAPRFSAAEADRLARSAIDAHEHRLRFRVTASTWTGAALEQGSLLVVELYRAMRAAGCDDAEARRWAGEVTWAVWSRVTSVPWAISRLRKRSNSERLAHTVAMTRRFLSPPDFGVRAHEGRPEFDVTRCCMRDVFASEGMEHVCVATMCALDVRVAAQRGLRLRRSGTLAEGKACCDFAWEVPDL